MTAAGSSGANEPAVRREDWTFATMSAAGRPLPDASATAIPTRRLGRGTEWKQSPPSARICRQRALWVSLCVLPHGNSMNRSCRLDAATQSWLTSTTTDSVIIFFAAPYVSRRKRLQIDIGPPFSSYENLCPEDVENREGGSDYRV